MILCLSKKYESIDKNNYLKLFMKTTKLIKLDSEKVIFEGGFTVLSHDQLDKLKGGLRSVDADFNAGNCSNCGCTNVGCR